MSRRYSHITPTYVVDRVRLKVFERRNPDLPWLTRDMIAFLSSWVRSSDEILETGSGRSTIWFARRSKRVISIEHDPGWHRYVCDRFRLEGLENVEYYLATDEEAYLDPICSIPPGTLDIALIDGVFRDRCALAAIPALKSGGLLVIDNSNWYLPHPSRSPDSRGQGSLAASPMWDRVGKEIADWRSFWTSNGITDTAAWQKP